MLSAATNLWTILSKFLARLDGADASLLMFDDSIQTGVLILPINKQSEPNHDNALVEAIEISTIVRRLKSSDVPSTSSEHNVIQILLPQSSATCVATIPIRSGNQNIGILNIGATEEFPEATLTKWQVEAQDLGNKLAATNGPVHKRDVQLNLIHRLGRQDVWEMTLEDFHDLAVVSIRENLSYDNVSLFVLDEPHTELILTAHAGAYRSRVSKGYRQSIEVGILGWVSRNRQMRLVNDVSREELYFGYEELDTRSEICFPIVIDNTLEGVLNVESDIVNAFDEGDVVALEALVQQIGDVIKMHHQRQAFARLQAEMTERHRFGDLLGQSEPMHRVFELIQTVSKSDLAVLIRGETGTGKELVARAIHNESDRKDKPFIAVNCAAIPESLFETELFGHEKGAFTGADRLRIGKMELANGGTLFLDEVGEISMAMQAKLLRAIEEQAFTRIGGESDVHVNVRILSATNRPLEELDQQGKFRRDLFFRLNAVQIHLPALRERVEDIPLLSAHFLNAACVRFDKQIQTIAPPVIAELVGYTWPGNVRELQNVIARAVLSETESSLSQVDISQSNLELPDLQPTLPEGIENMGLRETCRASLENIEREYIRTVLTLTLGNISKAAEQAGITRRTLYNKMEMYGMRREDFVPSR